MRALPVPAFLSVSRRKQAQARTCGITTFPAIAFGCCDSCASATLSFTRFRFPIAAQQQSRSAKKFARARNSAERASSDPGELRATTAETIHNERH